MFYCKGWGQLANVDGDLWEGDVETGNGGSELKLNAEKEAGTNQFSTLLLYQVCHATYK